jgi:hypothetical protein
MQELAQNKRLTRHNSLLELKDSGKQEQVKLKRSLSLNPFSRPKPFSNKNASNPFASLSKETTALKPILAKQKIEQVENPFSRRKRTKVNKDEELLNDKENVGMYDLSL